MEPRRKVLRQFVAGAAAAVAGGHQADAADPGASASPAGEARPATHARIKIGQIGVGHAHADKLSFWRQSPDYEVVGIVEPDAALRARAESHAAFKGIPWMTQERLLDEPGLQAVLVETGVRRLLDAAEACVTAGKHVHIDKPAGTSLVQLRRLLDTAANKRLLVQMGYMYRYNPGVVFLRRIVREGWLGEIFEANAAMSKVMSLPSRRMLAAYPGGALFEFGGYLIDMIYKILGPAERVIGFVQHAAAVDDALADNGLAVLTYPRALATIRSSVMEVQGEQRRHVVVCGTEGTCHVGPLDNPVVTLTLARPREEYPAGTHEIKMPRYTRHVDDAADMAKVIRGEKPTDFSYEHDFAVHRALFEACGLPLDM
jgi:predicted dehydrogenase